jgi:hypothetical protein
LWDGKGRFGDDEPKRKRARRVVESEEEEAEEEAGSSSKKVAVRVMPKRAGKAKEKVGSEGWDEDVAKQERMAEVARIDERIRLLQAMRELLLS